MFKVKWLILFILVRNEAKSNKRTEVGNYSYENLIIQEKKDNLINLIMHKRKGKIKKIKN